MKKFAVTTGIVLFLLLVLGFVGVGMGQDSLVTAGGKPFQGQEMVPDEILVKFKAGVGAGKIAALNARHGTAEISTSGLAGYKRLKIPRRKTVAEMVALYSRNPNVEYAEPNFLAQAFWAPNDPYYFPFQWHLHNAAYGGINMEEAWTITTGNAQVIVAVIDTGVAYEDYTTDYRKAPDLANTAFVPGYDFVNDDAHPNDDEGHGTHVAGTIAQSTDNAAGVAGIAFNTSLMPVKVLNSSGSGTYDAIASGIYFAADHGARVINLSLGGSSASTTLENALAYAYNRGVTIVCASGNNGSATTVSYPAAYDEYCIAVGATRYDEAVAYYSNRGASLDLTAPGGDVTVDQNGDGYGDGVLQQTFGSTPTSFGYYFYQGTSMAAPHVSGVAALLLARNPSLTPAAVRAALQVSAEDQATPGWDAAYGWGIVDARGALDYVAAANTAPVAMIGAPATGTEDVVVNFDGSGSYDADGDTLTYLWSFGDGSTGAGATPAHTYAAGGAYAVTLIVSDGKADSAPAATTLPVEEVNDPPVADAGPDRAATVAEPLGFDALAGSYDIDDGIAACQWNFGDGAAATGIATTHAYAAAGSYTVTLTVTDGGGLTDSDQATVTVTDASATVAHVANIAMSFSTRTVGKNSFVKALATVSIKNGAGQPVPGATVAGSWSGATSGTASAVTGTNGQAIIASAEIKRPKRGTTFTYAVTNVVKPGWSYAPSQNTETRDSITY